MRVEYIQGKPGNVSLWLVCYVSRSILRHEMLLAMLFLQLGSGSCYISERMALRKYMKARDPITRRIRAWPLMMINFIGSSSPPHCPSRLSCWLVQLISPSFSGTVNRPSWPQTQSEASYRVTNSQVHALATPVTS
ncbi:hypothetical protein FRC12_022798 [Ceratobasidium sp. 428]|nr:hypothetical protein FRC12_022798 [Ceratobasidium sp. 428]